MLMSELKDQVLTEVGSFYLDDLSLLEIQANQFLSIVRNSLYQWRENYFIDRRLLTSPDTEGRIDFTDMVAVGKIPSLPISITNVFPQSSSQYADIPTVAYQYDKPVLKLITWINQAMIVDYKEGFALTKVSEETLPTSTVDASAWDPNRIPFSNSIPHNVTQPVSPSEILKGYEIKDIENNDNYWLFLNLVTAKFMTALGTSRNSFVINDLPVMLDGSDLISRGKELMDQTVETMNENSDCFLDLLDTPNGGLGW